MLDLRIMESLAYSDDAKFNEMTSAMYCGCVTRSMKVSLILTVNLSSRTL
jgi:hypothetical protein